MKTNCSKLLTFFLLQSFLFFQFNDTFAAPLKVGILCAVPLEMKNLSESYEVNYGFENAGKRVYQHGLLHGLEAISTHSRVGKVAAATATTHIIQKYQPDIIVFIGTAASLSSELAVGDVVIGESLIQHDLNCSPIIPQFQIPLLNVTEIKADPRLVGFSENASLKFISSIQNEASKPIVKKGLIISGDQVIASAEQKETLKSLLPDALCVEMEGAAVAQVCYEYDIPFVILRVVSDDGTHAASKDCFKFLKEQMPEYSQQLLFHLFKELKTMEQGDE